MQKVYNMFWVPSGSPATSVSIPASLLAQNIDARLRGIKPAMGTFSSSTNTVSLSDTEAAKVKLASGVLALKNITASCHAIRNTVIVEPSSKPDWFASLNTNLSSAKTFSAEWINTIAPRLTATIPMCVIDYNDTYSVVSEKIRVILQRYAGTASPSDSDLNEIRDMVKVLMDKVGEVQNDVTKCTATLNSWGDNMQGAHNDLVTGTTSIQAAIASTNADIKSFNDAITRLNSDINRYSDWVTGSAITTLVGAVTIGIGAAVCFVNPLAGKITIGVGIAITATGASLWGIKQNDIENSYKLISQNHAKISASNQLLGSLKGLSVSTNGAVSAISAATSNLSEFKVMWTSFGLTLDQLYTALSKGKSGVSTGTIDTDIGVAANKWSRLHDYAEQLIGAAASTDAKIVRFKAA